MNRKIAQRFQGNLFISSQIIIIIIVATNTAVDTIIIIITRVDLRATFSLPTKEMKVSIGAS